MNSNVMNGHPVCGTFGRYGTGCKTDADCPAFPHAIAGKVRSFPPAHTTATLFQHSLHTSTIRLSKFGGVLRLRKGSRAASPRSAASASTANARSRTAVCFHGSDSL
jgi:hypothetical protein